MADLGETTRPPREKVSPPRSIADMLREVQPPQPKPSQADAEAAHRTRVEALLEQLVAGQATQTALLQALVARKR